MNRQEVELLLAQVEEVDITWTAAVEEVLKAHRAPLDKPTGRTLRQPAAMAAGPPRLLP
eukprot:gene6483-6710_t